jgi:hypothetical protein
MICLPKAEHASGEKSEGWRGKDYTDMGFENNPAEQAIKRGEKFTDPGTMFTTCPSPSGSYSPCRMHILKLSACFFLICDRKTVHQKTNYGLDAM